MKKLLLLFAILLSTLGFLHAEEYNWAVTKTDKSEQKASSTQNYGGVTWTITQVSYGPGFFSQRNGTTSILYGSSSNSVKEVTWTATTPFSGKNIESISVTAFQGKKASITLKVEVNGETVGSKNLTSTSATYDFTNINKVLADGKTVTLSFINSNSTNETNNTLNICGVNIVYSDGGSTTEIGTPIFTPASGATIDAGTNVTVTATNAAYLMVQGPDGSNVNESAAAASLTFTPDVTGTYTAYAYDATWNTQTSQEASATYTIKTTEPQKPGAITFTPAPGEVAKGTTVTVHSENATAIGYYFNNDQNTFDVADGDTYTFVVNEATTITAYGSNDAGDTQEATATYTIKDETPSDEIDCEIIFANQGWSGQPYSASNKTATWKSENDYIFSTTVSVSVNNTYPRWDSPNLRLYTSSNNEITVSAPNGYKITRVSGITESCRIDDTNLEANGKHIFDNPVSSFVWAAFTNKTDFAGMTITLVGEGGDIPVTDINVTITGENASKGIDRKTVTITADDADATIYYTTDGSTPTEGSDIYKGAFDLTPATKDTKSATVKALAVNGDKSGTASQTFSYTYYHVPNISAFLALPTGSTKYVIDGDMTVAFHGKLSTSTGDDIFVCDYSGENGQMVGLPIHTAPGKTLNYQNENGHILHGALGVRGVWCNIPQMTLAAADHSLHQATDKGDEIVPPTVLFPEISTQGHKYENTIVKLNFVEFVSEQPKTSGTGRSYIFNANNFSSSTNLDGEDLSVTMACRHEFDGREDLQVSENGNHYYYNVTGIAVSYKADDATEHIPELFISQVEPTDLTLPAPEFFYSEPWNGPEKLITLTNENEGVAVACPIHITHEFGDHVQIYYTKDGTVPDIYNATTDPSVYTTTKENMAKATSVTPDAGTFLYTGPFHITKEGWGEDHDLSFKIKAVAVLKSTNTRHTELWEPSYTTTGELTDVAPVNTQTAKAEAEVGTRSVTGVENITAEGSTGEAVYYNLQGVKVDGDNLTPGIYVRRQGNTATKVMVK